MKCLIVFILFSVLTEIVVSDHVLCLPGDNENPLCSPCEKNEIWVTVLDLIPERTCQHPIPLPNITNSFPEKIQRCECNIEKGYIRDEKSGSCVPIKECSVCTKNEVLNENPTPCQPEATCGNPNPKPSEPCEEDCEPRCECKDGFVRDEASRKCIPKQSCLSASCSDNEKWVECAEACTPEKTCRNQNPKPTSEVCTLQCVGRCECDEGYIRDQCTNKCIRIEECEDKECTGEYWNDCASACLPEPTCFYRYPNKSGVVCNKKCVGRYECNSELGYIRDPTTGKCTLECPDKCGLNQVRACRTGEEATCNNPNPSLRTGNDCDDNDDDNDDHNDDDDNENHVDDDNGNQNDDNDDDDEYEDKHGNDNDKDYDEDKHDYDDEDKHDYDDEDNHDDDKDDDKNNDDQEDDENNNDQDDDKDEPDHDDDEDKHDYDDEDNHDDDKDDDDNDNDKDDDDNEKDDDDHDNDNDDWVEECLCAEGYVRNTADGTCILEKYCPNYKS